jgi:tetratricopeptide (TPR) repeat protein
MFEDKEWIGEIAKAAEFQPSDDRQESILEDSYHDDDSDCESGLDMNSILAKVQQQMNAYCNTFHRIHHDVALQAPEIRPSTEIIVEFTSRKNMLSTVARETEDAKYLATLNAMKQQAAAREVKGRIELSPEDDLPNLTPDLLKQKGDQWFAQGNFESAVNAYSTALGKDPSQLRYPFE